MTEIADHLAGSLNKDYKAVATAFLCITFIYFWRDEYITNVASLEDLSMKKILKAQVSIIGKVYAAVFTVYVIYIFMFIIYLQFLSTEKLHMFNFLSKFNIDIGLTFVKLIPFMIVLTLTQSCLQMLFMYIFKEGDQKKTETQSGAKRMRDYVFSTSLYFTLLFTISYTYYSGT